MREIVHDLIEWSRSGRDFVMATVIGVERSAPLGPGATMAVASDGTVRGSVSGGCVEPALLEEARGIIQGADPSKLSYGIADDEAFGVGLTCGGTVHIWLESGSGIAPLLQDIRDRIAADEAFALVTVLDGEDRGAKLLIVDGASGENSGGASHDERIADAAADLLASGTTAIMDEGPGANVFVQCFVPRSDMYVFGAVDYSDAVSRMGSFLGYRVTVCDPREPFATKDRFPYADHVVVAWPDEFLRSRRTDQRTAVCVLSHDPKFDVPVLQVALDIPTGYIGALGSRRTHADRTRRLLEAGVREEELVRIRSPIGLDLGARTPQEVAIAIGAEIILLRSGRAGPRASVATPLSLSQTAGSVSGGEPSR